MSDTLHRLVPPIPPHAPLVVDAPDHSGWLALLLCLALAALLLWLIPATRRISNRHRLRKALQRLARNDAGLSPEYRAQLLITLVRRFGLTPPARWWSEADTIRFSRPGTLQPARADTLITELSRWLRDGSGS